MKVSLTALVLCFVGIALTHATPPCPLQNGEHLTYRVSWAVVPGAGEIKIDARQDPANKDRLIVTTLTATRGRIARFLLPFDARAESTFDLNSAKLLSLHETSTTRGKHTEHTVAFDYVTREAVYRRLRPPEPARTIPIPPGDPSDLIMALLQTRSWDLKPGEKRDALVLFDDDFYELTIHALRYEEVKTPMGTFNTLVLEPRMEKTAPKGMFKRGSTVRVWIAQDAHRLPVRFEVEFKIGTGTATLEKYEPPSAANAASPVKAVSKDAKNSGP